jgi:hypothetical protein
MPAIAPQHPLTEWARTPQKFFKFVVSKLTSGKRRTTLTPQAISGSILRRTDAVRPSRWFENDQWRKA